MHPGCVLPGIAGSREQGAESREQRAESREQRAESMEQGAWSMEQGAGSREQGAGSREQGVLLVVISNAVRNLNHYIYTNRIIHWMTIPFAVHR